MLIVPPQEWEGKPIANADNATLDYLTDGMMVNLPTAATANSTMGGEDFLGYYLQLTDENRTTNIGPSPQVANADFPYSLTDDSVSVGDTVCAVALPYNSVGSGDATDALVYKC